MLFDTLKTLRKLSFQHVLNSLMTLLANIHDSRYSYFCPIDIESESIHSAREKKERPKHTAITFEKKEASSHCDRYIRSTLGLRSKTHS